eukprot:UN12839
MGVLQLQKTDVSTLNKEYKAYTWKKYTPGKHSGRKKLSPNRAKQGAPPKQATTKQTAPPPKQAVTHR